MSCNSYCNKHIKKDIIYEYSCGRLVAFYDVTIRADVLKVALILHNDLHNYQIDVHNKANNNNQRENQKISCKYCGQHITFYDNIIAGSGKKIPLNLNQQRAKAAISN